METRLRHGRARHASPLETRTTTVRQVRHPVAIHSIPLIAFEQHAARTVPAVCRRSWRRASGRRRCTH